MTNEAPRQKREDLSAWRAKIPQKVLEPMSRCIGKLDRIRRPLEQSRLRSYHLIGATLLENCDAVDEMMHVATIYRANAWELLSDRLDMDPRILRDCLAFAREFNLAQVDELVACGVQWSHVVPLLSVRVVTRRWEYVRRIRDEGLTTEKLHDELFGERGRRRPSVRGVQALPKTPKTTKVTPKKALDKLAKFNREVNALFAPETDLARCLTADVLDVDQRDQVDQLRAECETLARKFSHIASAINRTQGQPAPDPAGCIEVVPTQVNAAVPPVDAAPKPPRRRRPPPALRNSTLTTT